MTLVKKFYSLSHRATKESSFITTKKILLTKRGQLSGTVTAVFTKNGASCVAGVATLCVYIYIYACVCT
jgi:hypothetical protein